MSGRRRRSESLWDSKEEAIPPTENSGKIPSRAKELHSSFNGNNSPKWSNLEATDALMSDDFSGQPSWELMQGNENLPADNDISRDRCRMLSDPAFDEWENQYSSRPSDDSYGMQYRVRDRGVGRTGSMSSRGRNRSRSSSRSPKRNRSMDRDRGGTRRMAGSRSRSRDRGPHNRGSHGNRKDSGLDEEATDTAKDAYLCNDFVKGRNVHDDQERQQSNRDSKEPCKFFAVGKCNRKHCKFSHDILESGGYDVTSHDNIQGHDLGNKNLTWNDPQLRDDLNASGFSDLAASNRSFDGKNKLWSGPSWDEVESGGFNELSHDEIPLGFFPEISQPHNLDPRASGSRIANAPIATIPEVSGISGLQQHPRPGDDTVAMVMDESNAHNVDMVSKDANQQNLSYRQDFIQNIYGMGSQLRSNLNGTEQSGHMLSLSPLNGLNDSIQLQGMFLDLDSGKHADIQNKESGKPLESKEQIPQVSNLPSSLPQMSQNITNAIEFLNSLANSASCGPPIDCIVTQQNLDKESNKQHESARDLEASESTKMSVPTGVLEHQKPIEKFAPNSNELCAVGAPEEGRVKNSMKNKQEPVTNLEGNEGENTKHEQENVSHGGNDEKAIRLFKAALVEFVKEILKPTWKEGKMSREVYKTVVKKVVDKVTSTIQGTQIPKTQERIDQYLAFSKSKITKLVEAYVERFLKA